MVVLMALGGSVEATAQRHRHTPRVEVADSTSKNESIEAYSDTSSVAAASSDVDDNDDDDAYKYSPSRFSDPFSWLGYMIDGFGGIVAFIVVLFVFCLLLSPLIVLVLILRYIVRRHNDRVRLAEMAMEHGQPLSDEQLPLSRKSPEYMWRRGVRNVSIGVGLMLFFWFLGASALVGIGGLWACLGAGQMFMVRYNYNSTFGRKKNDADANDGFGNVTDLKFDDEDKEKL